MPASPGGRPPRERCARPRSSFAGTSPTRFTGLRFRWWAAGVRSWTPLGAAVRSRRRGARARAHLETTGSLSNKMQDGAFLEPQCALAELDLQGRLTLWTSTQSPHYVARTVAMLINEGADAVQQGVCTPEGADTAMKLGVNYPAGPFEWLAQWPAAEVVTLLDALDSYYRGERYRVSPWLRRRAHAAP